MKKSTYIIIIAVIVLVGFVVAKAKGVFGKEDLLKVSVEITALKSITETVAASGTIQPEVEVNISADVSGEIIELLVIEGQEVQKGDVLLRINPDIYESGLSRAEAALNNAFATLSRFQAELKDAELKYNRNKDLYEKGAISKADFEASTVSFEVSGLNVKGAEFSVESAKATVKEAKDNLQFTTIYAPVSGTVIRLNNKEGERVVGTAQMAGTVVMTIADLAAMEVLVEVSENDIVRVSQNDTTWVEVDAYQGRRFKGLVSHIANSSQQTTAGVDQVTNFDVKVSILSESYSDLLEGNKKPFRPGMSASVEIMTDHESNIISVPIQAVTTRFDTASYERRSVVERFRNTENEEEYICVFVLEDGKAKIRLVKAGIQDDENIHIVNGLEEGEEVITAPFSAVSKDIWSGRKLEVVSKDNLYDTTD